MYNKAMNNFCKKCGLCCKLIPIYNGSIIRDGLQPVEEFYIPLGLENALYINENYVKNVQNIFPDAEFYTCKYLSNDNLCTKPEMPEACKKFPETPLAFIPEQCGYSGEIFIKSEALKQKIRKYKEEILNYETLIIANPKEKNCYKKIISTLNNHIKKYEKYGSLNW